MMAARTMMVVAVVTTVVSHSSSGDALHLGLRRSSTGMRSTMMTAAAAARQRHQQAAMRKRCKPCKTRPGLGLRMVHSDPATILLQVGHHMVIVTAAMQMGRAERARSLAGPVLLDGVTGRHRPNRLLIKLSILSYQFLTRLEQQHASRQQQAPVVALVGLELALWATASRTPSLNHI
jgi:hypothetical protein